MMNDSFYLSSYDYLFIELAVPPTIASAVNYGLNRVQAYYSGSAQYYWETYNILGDPSTRIWLGPRTKDFWMTSESSEIGVCTGTQIDNNINVISINDFASDVSLSISNLPTFVTGWLTPISLIPTASSILTIDVAGEAFPGEYPITIYGTTEGITHDIPLTISIQNSVPETVTLMLPLDKSTTDYDDSYTSMAIIEREL